MGQVPSDPELRRRVQIDMDNSCISVTTKSPPTPSAPTTIQTRDRGMDISNSADTQAIAYTAALACTEKQITTVAAAPATKRGV